jgi:hypothetical protein
VSRGALTPVGNDQPFSGMTIGYPPFFRPVRKTSIEVFRKLLAPVDPAGAERKARDRKTIVPA